MEKIGPVRQAVSSIVSSEGKSVLKETKKFEQLLRNYLKNESTILQAIYILKAGNIGSYIDKNELSFVEINNIIINAENNTDIRRDVIEEYVYAILEGCGYKLIMPASKAAINTNMKNSGAFVVGDYAKQLDEIDDAVKTVFNIDDKEKPTAFEKSAREDAIQKIILNSSALKKASEQDNARACFLTALCYGCGLGVEQSDSLELEYLKRADKLGYPSASAILGNFYFRQEKYTDAYNCYTQIGAVAVNKEARANLINILNSVKTNITAFVFSVICYFLIVIFDVLLMKGSFCPNGCTHYPSGIISVVISTAAFAALSYFSFKKKYDIPKYSLAAMTLLFCMTTFFAFAI